MSFKRWPGIEQKIEWSHCVFATGVVLEESDADLQCNELFDGLGLLPVLVIERVEIMRFVSVGDRVASELSVDSDEITQLARLSDQLKWLIEVRYCYLHAFSSRCVCFWVEEVFFDSSHYRLLFVD